jgi:5-deoxy-glucuronate isomerase
VNPSSSVHEATTMRMEIIGLDPGETLELEAPPGEEALALLVAGGVEAGSDTAERQSPFDPPLAGWYLPPGESWSARASSPAMLATVTTADAGLEGTGGDVAFAEAAAGETRGRDEWQREVITLIDPSVGSQRLIAGQTSHADGGWSSYPPHRHDGSGDEPYFEEIYHYRFDPPSGFGFQGLYSGDDPGEAHLIRDGETITISRGYHPVCAAPGYRFTYFWALCGPAERFEQVDDPVHAWVAGS